METKSLLKPTDDEKKAVQQLKNIIGEPINRPFSLIASDWQRSAKLWLLISQGHYVEYALAKDLNRLRNAGVRQECEGVIRRWGLTLEQAAKDFEVKL